MNVCKPIIAALGLSVALAAGSASAALTLDSQGEIFLQDDNLDFHFRPDADGNLQAVAGGGELQVGDVLFSVFEFETANGDDISALTGGGELTGVLAGQLIGINAFGQSSFASYSEGLQSILDDFGYTGVAIPEGGAGEGALGAVWLDSTPNLDIDAGLINDGDLSCTSLTQCIAQATDGNLWEVDGFTGEASALGGVLPDPSIALGGNGANEYWVSNPGGVIPTNDTGDVLLGSIANNFANVSAGASLFYDGSGLNLGTQQVSGDLGPVDVTVIGPVNGANGSIWLADEGLSALYEGLYDDGWIGTSDFDLKKAGTAVPEPSILALLAAGFIGVGAARRRRKA